MSDRSTIDVSNGPAEPLVIVVLGSPGAGKGTLSAHLAEKYGLAHYSVGDSLRDWMRVNRDKPLAFVIQDKLDNQGFLSSLELNPFIREAIAAAVRDPEQKFQGIIIDGYPRCIEQLNSFDQWPFEYELPRHHSHDSEGSRVPDMVIAIRAKEANARARFVGRTRDARDSVERFEKRFAEYENETVPVEDVYRSRGLLVEVDANGTKDESIVQLEQQLGKSRLWNNVRNQSNIRRAGHVEEIGEH